MGLHWDSCPGRRGRDVLVQERRRKEADRLRRLEVAILRVLLLRLLRLLLISILRSTKLLTPVILRRNGGVHGRAALLLRRIALLRRVALLGRIALLLLARLLCQHGA